MHKLKYSEENERKIINILLIRMKNVSEKGTINCLTMVMKTPNVLTRLSTFLYLIRYDIASVSSGSNTTE